MINANGASVLKLVTIGDSGVGKTSLIVRYTENVFYDYRPSTVGVDFVAKKIKIDKKEYSMQIWDTAGQEKFRAMVKCYFKSAKALALVFDVTRKETFETLDNW
eukprot:CAMPEP_0114581452 /NCGR_PEP_ID=MMETSP0125-20121206/5559_1 /TAXON_ID=485358 ORGANISM="Aristerostoma sp., Strain ATCC 50986" /NCGR_SAMPLE_ID=MMETSP0125 /ASSEMBLY_ACC=CAM_ASM_000245 /LENGTH=103 /DNA_ID=CAMNT_0001773671 /DNA_START=69 /DNA_END=377 /DNA_ORIENTATION=-